MRLKCIPKYCQKAIQNSLQRYQIDNMISLEFLLRIYCFLLIPMETLIGRHFERETPGSEERCGRGMDNVISVEKRRRGKREKGKTRRNRLKGLQGGHLRKKEKGGS